MHSCQMAKVPVAYEYIKSSTIRCSDMSFFKIYTYKHYYDKTILTYSTLITNGKGAISQLIPYVPNTAATKFNAPSQKPHYSSRTGPRWRYKIAHQRIPRGIPPRAGRCCSKTSHPLVRDCDITHEYARNVRNIHFGCLKLFILFARNRKSLAQLDANSNNVARLS